MTHPRILNKSFTQITEAARIVIERLYLLPSNAASDAQGKFDRARGALEMWSEVTFDMGTSEHINIATQAELEQLLCELDTMELARWNLPPRSQ